MDRMKTFLKYALLLILFMIFSEILINVGLNSTYKKIERQDNVSQVNVYQAEATLVNGRIRGLITNSQEQNLSGKFLEIEFYSKRDVFLGKKYIQLEQLEPNGTQSFEALFKLKEVAKYKVDIVDHKKDGGEIDLLPAELTVQEIWVATFITLLIFW